MPPGSRVCPHCGALNGADETVCYRCNERLPGPVVASATAAATQLLGNEAPMTKVYIGICALAYLFIVLGSGKFELLGGVRLSEALRWGAVVSDSLATKLGIGGVMRVEPWRYLGATFLHFGILHIGFNMVGLWDLGRATEQRLGSGRFSLIFVGTSIAGFVVSDFWYSFTQGDAYTGGASAGLFGLIGALVGYLYAAKDPVWKQFLMRVVVYAAIFAVALPVNNAAHIGGCVAGFPLGYVFYRENRPWQKAALFRVVAGVLLLASLASIALSQRSPLWREVRRAELDQGMD